MIYIGMDPGLEGGIAAFAGGVMTAVPMPLAGKYMDGSRICDFIDDARDGCLPVHVTIEDVHAMPDQGVTSMFNFGRGFGQLIGLCQARAWPYALVPPQAWKKVVLAGTAKDKAAAIAWCRRSFPNLPLVPPGCRVPHDGMADAVCLASYGATAR